VILAVLTAFEVALRIAIPYKPNLDAYIDDPEVGKVLRPGFRGSDFRKHVEINSHGMRDREFSVKKPPGIFRILVLGDSWTFGAGVETEDSWPKRLEAILNQERGGGFEVVNTGVPGYETFNEAVVYARDRAKFEHDLVVVGLYPVNDVHAKKERYASESALRERSPLLHWIVNFPNRHFYFLHWYRQWRKARADRRCAEFYARTTALPDDHPDRHAFGPREEDWTALYNDAYSGWVTMKESLVSIGRTASTHGARGVVVLFPDLRDLRRYTEYCHPRVAPKIRRAVEEAGLVFVDLEEDFRAYQGREIEIALGSDWGSTHPGPPGHDLIARAIARELQARGFVDSQTESRQRAQ